MTVTGTYKAERVEVIGDELPRGTIIVDRTRQGPPLDEADGRCVILTRLESDEHLIVGLVAEEDDDRTVIEIWDSKTYAAMEKAGALFQLRRVRGRDDARVLKFIEAH
jgi:hypothetical protein